MIATGNTVGQGDEHGMYNGARPQSLAFLNRFPCWVQVPYLDKKERKKLLDRVVEGLTKTDSSNLMKYVELHLSSFEKGDIIQPISPRTFLAIGRKCVFYNAMKVNKPLEKAIIDTVLNACNSSDRSVLSGAMQRALG